MKKTATIGDNNPPSNYEVIEEEIHDLYDEAKNWIDGAPIENQGTADQVEKLMGMIKTAQKQADDYRKEEVAPYDEAKSEIQTKYNKLIGKTKTVTGKTILAIQACQQALTPWKQKLQDEQDAAAKLQQEEAERLQREAEAARADDSLENKEKAQGLAEEALKTAKKARQITKNNVKGLRTIWDVVITDETQAFRSMWKTHKVEIMDVVQTLAERDVSHSIRTIEGFEITSRKVAR